MTSFHASRNFRTRPAVAVIGAALLLAACSHGGTGASKPDTTTTTLPPLPPAVIAYVALAGTVANVGTGSTLVEVTLSPPPSSVGAPIKVGVYPDAVAVTPNGRLALVANYTSNTVTPVALPSGLALAAIPAGAGPADVAINSSGTTAYVTDANSDTVTPISLKTLKALAPITVGAGPQGIAITPNGTKAYVADAGAIIAGQSGTIGHQVTPIDLTTDRALPPISVGNAPIGVAITPDGSTVFVTNLNSESVSTISVGSDTAGAAIAVAGGPVAVAVAAGEAWVVNTPAGGQTGNNVQPISLVTDAAGKPINLPKGAQNIAVAPNGRTAYVVCLDTDKLVPVGLISHRVETAISIPGGPFAVAVANQARAAAPGQPTSTTVAKKKKTTTTT
ncbi:MAG TPA: YncE family protein [Acidimicrobiales bacterium]|nr:YncE family protein [Acidimicrobiales bacterium]